MAPLDLLQRRHEDLAGITTGVPAGAKPLEKM
jgi:hypothetical protein